jgi:hypothetical protein
MDRNFARFHVLTETSMKMAVFWDVKPYSLVDIDRRFRSAYCLLEQSNVCGTHGNNAQHPRRHL